VTKAAMWRLKDGGKPTGRQLRSYGASYELSWLKIHRGKRGRTKEGEEAKEFGSPTAAGLEKSDYTMLDNYVRTMPINKLLLKKMNARLSGGGWGSTCEPQWEHDKRTGVIRIILKDSGTEHVLRSFYPETVQEDIDETVKATAKRHIVTSKQKPMRMINPSGALLAQRRIAVMNKLKRLRGNFVAIRHLESILISGGTMETLRDNSKAKGFLKAAQELQDAVDVDLTITDLLRALDYRLPVRSK